MMMWRSRYQRHYSPTSPVPNQPPTANPTPTLHPRAIPPPWLRMPKRSRHYSPTSPVPNQVPTAHPAPPFDPVAIPPPWLRMPKRSRHYSPTSPVPYQPPTANLAPTIDPLAIPPPWLRMPKRMRHYSPTSPVPIQAINPVASVAVTPIAIDVETPVTTEAAEDSQQVGGGRPPITIQLGPSQRAFKNTLLSQTLIPSRATDDLKEFLEALIPYLQTTLEQLLDEHSGLKFWINVQVQFFHTVTEDLHTAGLQTKTITVLNSFELDYILRSVADDLSLRLAHYLRNGSPLTVASIDSATLHTAKYAPLSAGTYKELPTYLKLKRCIVNVQNTDNRCFGYSILAFLHRPAGEHANPNRPNQYDRYFAQHALDQINYPVAPGDIPAIEEQINLNISVFSFFDDQGKGRFPLYASKKRHPISIDLLYWDEHYALITSFDRFVFDLTKFHGKKHICRNCFGHFWTEETLANHQLFCSRPDFTTQLYTLPPPGTQLKYTNVRFQHRMPFVVYAGIHP